MKLKINLYGNAFLHNIVEGKISSTDNQTPQYVEFVTDGSGEINLFVDSGLFEIEQLHSSKPNYGWMLESKSIRPDIFEYFSKDIENKIAPFEKIFTHNHQLIQKSSKFEFLHPIGYWVDSSINLNKTKLVSMITSDKKKTSLQKKGLNLQKKYS